MFKIKWDEVRLNLIKKFLEQGKTAKFIAYYFDTSIDNINILIRRNFIRRNNKIAYKRKRNVGSWKKVWEKKVPANQRHLKYFRQCIRCDALFRSEGRRAKICDKCNMALNGKWHKNRKEGIKKWQATSRMRKRFLKKNRRKILKELSKIEW
jgi:hypothetical protein